MNPQHLPRCTTLLCPSLSQKLLSPLRCDLTFASFVKLMLPYHPSKETKARRVASHEVARQKKSSIRLGLGRRPGTNLRSNRNDDGAKTDCGTRTLDPQATISPPR